VQQGTSAIAAIFPNKDVELHEFYTEFPSKETSPERARDGKISSLRVCVLLVFVLVLLLSEMTSVSSLISIIDVSDLIFAVMIKCQ
jgi:hypothetical protein